MLFRSPGLRFASSRLRGTARTGLNGWSPSTRQYGQSPTPGASLPFPARGTCSLDAGRRPKSGKEWHAIPGLRFASSRLRGTARTGLNGWSPSTRQYGQSPTPGASLPFPPRGTCSLDAGRRPKSGKEWYPIPGLRFASSRLRGTARTGLNGWSPSTQIGRAHV